MSVTICWCPLAFVGEGDYGEHCALCIVHSDEGNDDCGAVGFGWVRREQKYLGWLEMRARHWTRYTHTWICTRNTRTEEALRVCGVELATFPT